MDSSKTETIDGDFGGKRLLFLFFIIGIPIILLFKTWADQPDGFLQDIFGTWTSIVPAIVSLLVIVSYVGLTYVTEQAYYEPDQVGDNCYYLGFSITLASLAFTLFQFDSAKLESSTFLPDAISAFGIALFSTIVGVIARVLMMRFNNDLTEKEKKTNVMINRAMHKFSKSMEEFATVVEGFPSKLRNIVHETDKLGTEIHQNLEKHTRILNEVQDERMKHATDSLVASFRESLSIFVSDIRDVNKEASAAVEGVTRSIDNVEKRTEKFEQVLVRVDEGITKAFSGVESGIERLDKNISNFGEATGRAISDMGEQMQKSGQVLAQMEEKVSGITSNIGSGLEQIDKSVADYSEAIIRAAKRLDEVQYSEIGNRRSLGVRVSLWSGAIIILVILFMIPGFESYRQLIMENVVLPVLESFGAVSGSE